MDWTGFYIGGHIGGGWSNANWSDPFGSAPSGFGGTNIAGFGDQTHATGPLGGGQIGANWQTGHLVLGAAADISAADLRGENTCFSGLGGINCQHNLKDVATLSGRVGFGWDRSLIYAKAGGAWATTTYDLNGNTFNVSLGTGSTNVTASGWLAGVGLEYALTDHWTTSFEYDHIGLGSATVPFPSVAVINSQSIGIAQTVDAITLGVNYKFDWKAPVLVVKD
jgi:opacity protein-like surface antigen